MKLLCESLSFVTLMSAQSKNCSCSCLDGVNPVSKHAASHAINMETLSCLKLELWKNLLDGFLAETAQGQQSAIVHVRPSMTAVDTDVILEPVGGGENGAREDTDILRQGNAIKL